MIGRADIEGSKSNVAMNAWLPRFHDVPPQQNSPPDNVLRLERPAEASLGSKRRGCYPSDSRSKRIPLIRTSYELAVRHPGKYPKRAVPSPSPGRLRPPADTRWSARAKLAAQAARQQSTGSKLGPPSPALRANPFPKVTDPFCRLPLPTLFHRPEVVHLKDLMRL
ncbi:unnamed protein product [Brassica rapa subsp. narinosa]